MNNGNFHSDDLPFILSAGDSNDYQWSSLIQRDLLLIDYSENYRKFFY